MTQKPFTELPKPAKKTYSVLVVEIPKDEAGCAFEEPMFNSANEVVGQLKCTTDNMSNAE